MSALQGESICILTLHMYVCMCNLFLQSLPGFVRACDPSSVGREILKLVPVQYNPRGVARGANTVPWHFYYPAAPFFLKGVDNILGIGLLLTNW